MASTELSPRRPTRTPARSRVNSRPELATEPPNKRRKFIPGGLGGGGRWEDNAEGDATPMEVTTRSSRALTAPRARSRRLSTELGDKDDEAETPTVTRSAMQTRPRRERPERYVPPIAPPRPRYSNSSSAAAASQASDGYKPREERSWEEFHPDMDLDAELMIFSADEVDGRVRKDDVKAAIARLEDDNGSTKPTINGDGEAHDVQTPQKPTAEVGTPVKRRPGRPPRQQTSMLNGLGLASPIPVKPLPIQSKGERLNLPKPSFRLFSHFLAFEEDQREIKVNYVDRTMSNLGYQESDRFELPAKFLVRL